ncbi:hypothetical protein LRS74_23295 [Streptomyces sp. LX-29]|uniref:hypothetical protein n=1 Tax=Streptomyces sp. LX-29 TaxID=2900152 RepID=UPI00240DE5B2|nr:hypothetical protein [Streptomyces sp. LX-29]WFB09643.1 hypothetical protein LRS74_23295 [Streptomyces sp. LX-29]
MSIPGDQTPNPYQQPPQQPGMPPAPPNPYGQVPPQPPQPNPYAQPPAGGTPGAAPGAVPPPAGFGAVTPPSGFPAPPGGGGGGKGKGWLWGVGGAVLASAVWAGTLFATGGFDGEEKADLGGYRYQEDLCASSDFSAFEGAGFREDTPDEDEKNPEHEGSEHAALDGMTCEIEYKPTGASSEDYSSASVYTSASLHKKTDPAPEFEAQYKAFETRKAGGDKYVVKDVSGVGDEAYLVTVKEKDGEDDGAYVILGVRDGWFTYQITWSEYVSSSSTGVTAVSPDKAGELLQTSAKATLAKLQK